MLVTQARYDEGATGDFSATLKDEDDVAISLASISALTLTLKNATTGTVINSRSAQNVLNANNVTVHATTGALLWEIQPADTTLEVSSESVEEHTAEFELTWASGKKQKHVHVLRCQRTTHTALCVFDDVKLWAKDIADSNQLFVERLIDAFTKRAENESHRAWRKATVTEYFTTRSGQSQIRLSRFPVDSITSIKESTNGDFSTATAMASTNYFLDSSRGIVRLRSLTFTEGPGAVQVVYTGGLARDVFAVPADLRQAAAKQVAFEFQRKKQLGVVSMSTEGASVSMELERDLLADVKRTLQNYSPVLW